MGEWTPPAVGLREGNVQAWGGVVSSSHPESCASVVTPLHFLDFPSTPRLSVAISGANLFSELPKLFVSQSSLSRVMALSANPGT